MQGAGENFVPTRDNMPKLKEQLQTAIQQMTEFEKLKSHIEMTVTTERLRIELSESASGTFFDTGSAKLRQNIHDTFSSNSFSSTHSAVRLFLLHRIDQSLTVC
jgi:flagellar motor protein MotB